MTSNGELHDPASISRAQELVRHAVKNMTSNIEVIVEGGVYYFDQPLVFTREDSGKGEFDVIWKAKDLGNKPVFSGGKLLDGKWELHDPDKNIYKLQINDPSFITRDLYVNSERCVLARSRDSVIGLQFDTEQAAYEATSPGGSGTTAGLGLKGSVADAVREYGDIGQLEAVRNVRWRHFVVPVEKVEHDIVYMSQTAWKNASATDRVHYDWNGASWRKYGGGVDYFQNAYALLDQKGEFFLDNTKHILYYIPRDGQNMETAEVIAPVLQKIMVVEGRNTAGITTPQPGREKGGIVAEKIRNIVFDGIAFQHNTFLRPGTADGYVCTQAGHTLTGPEEDGPFSDPWGSYAAPPHGAVYVNSGDRIQFVNCEFAKIGSTALIVTHGSRNCVVTKNTFTDLSGGAIYLGDAKHTSDTAPDPHQVGLHFSKTGILEPPIVPLEERELSYNNTISYNLVEWTGKQFPDTVAIWAGYEIGLRLVHNTVQHISYTGINVGWGWRETGRESRMRDNYIAYNRITDYLRKEADMHDGGGVYMVNAMPGTIIEYNYFNNRTGIGNAVYFDAGLDYAVLRHNVMTRIHHKWVSANVSAFHRGMVAYDNYTEKGYESSLHQHTFDGEYTIMGDNYIHTKVLPEEAIHIAKNAGHAAPYDDSAIDFLYCNLAEGRNVARSSDLSDAGHLEPNPWLEADLGESKPIHSIELRYAQEPAEQDRLTDFYVFISNHELRNKSLTEIWGDPLVNRTEVQEKIGNEPSVIKVADGVKGRYVRLQFKAATSMPSPEEIKINLNTGGSAIPYLKDTNASFNKSRQEDAAYDIYTRGTEVSSVLLDGNEIAADSYKAVNKKLIRNAFLAPEKISEYLASVGETNKWYPYVKATLASMQEAPATETGKTITLDKHVCASLETGKHTVTIRFENGMELAADLDVCEDV